MLRRISNPPNPWAANSVEWIGEPPTAELEVYEEDVKGALAENESPDVGFRWSLNPYRGCFHACAYCLRGDTAVLLADGTTKRLEDVRAGEEIFGVDRQERGVEAIRTRVITQWRVTKPAFRVALKDGTELVASADHRFLTEAGWKRVVDSPRRDARSAILTCGDTLISPGDLATDRRRILSVEPLGVRLPLFDITTGTGNFIANGVVSHNCYARSSHQYWGFGAGTDFDRKIIVKTNVAEKLREEFLRPSWQGEVIAFSGNTDCYQPLEAVYRLTRKSLEVCREFRNPVCLITKGALVRRDIDLLAAMARETKVSVSLSIPFADDVTGRAIEPGASLPSQRFETLRMLSEAGIRTGIAIAPVIPGLNDSHIATLLERAKSAGATSAFMILLRLSGQTLPVFEERLAEAFPDRAKKIWNAIEEMRGGKRNETRFHDRMVGRGPRWEAIEALFEAQCRRLGLNTRREDSGEEDSEDESSPFRRSSPQGELFSEPEN
jgi:DNA repair photolyase